MKPKEKPRFVDFKEVKRLVSIKQILEHYGLLADMKGRGDRLSGCCPFCEGDNPTMFRVSLEKNCFNCFGCEAGGNILDFVQEQENCSIRAAALQIVDWFDLEMEPPPKMKRAKSPSKRSKRERASVQEEANTPARKTEKSSNSSLSFELELDPEHPWFEEIGLEPETVAEFGLGFCSKGLMRGCIAFPVHSADGEILAYLGRLPTDSEGQGETLWRYPKAQHFQPELEVFNQHRVEAGCEQLLFASDPLELVQLWQGGDRNVVCLLASDVPSSTIEKLHGLVA